MPAEIVPFVGKGGSLNYNIDMTTPATSTTAYTKASFITKFDPKVTRGEVDNVYLDSIFKSMLSTLPEATVDISGKYVPGDAGTALFVALTLNGASAHWLYKTLAGSSIAFDGFITSYSVSFENEKAVEYSGSIRIQTLPVFVPAT